MVPDWKTNFVYFSAILPEKHSRIFNKLKSILIKGKIPFDFIYNTADIWCRDYMPVQINKEEFVQFIYDPDYLKKAPYKHLKTRQDEIKWDKQGKLYLSDLVLDGGSLVYSEKAVIINEKVLELNKNFKKEELLEKLAEILKVPKVYVVPRQPYEIYGHVDSMIRFVDKNTILVNDFSKGSRNFQHKFFKALEKMPFTPVFLKIKRPHRYSWCYLNYLRVGDVIIIPVIGKDGEEEVIFQIKEVFKKQKIYTLPCSVILRRGGALHCISWNIKKLSL